MSKESLKSFWENRSLVDIVDKVAQRYGVTPYQVITQMSVYEFSFNIAVMTVGTIEDGKRQKNATGGSPPNKNTWSGFGIGHKTVSKRPPESKEEMEKWPEHCRPGGRE